ncbi:MAG: sulfite exporter TauE/SafE family protein [Candidatus Heimdallarchaeota archaeon]|nr:sulfite exporter TauE/SafE family protein [Candidatus Heimdallarchaeota archaeon]
MDFVSFMIMATIGLGTGIITSFIGASGVVVVVPLVLLLFEVDVHTALGISLMVDFIASIVVSFTYYRKGNVEFKSGLWLAVGAVAGSQLGAVLVQSISGSFLGPAFGIAAIIIGFILVAKNIFSPKETQVLPDRKNKGHHWADENYDKSLLKLLPEKNSMGSSEVIHVTDKVEGDQNLSVNKRFKKMKSLQFKRGWVKIIFTVTLGFVLGVGSGIFGAGGGAIILVVLIVVLALPLHKAIGTSTLIMALTAFSSSVGFAIQGSINYVMGGVIGIGAVIGGYFGSLFANHVSERILIIFIGIIGMVLGILMLLI